MSTQNNTILLSENNRVLKFIKKFQSKNEYNYKFLDEYNAKFRAEFDDFLNNSNLTQDTINFFSDILIIKT